MGPGIIIPVLVVAIVVPTVFVWAHRKFKETDHDSGEQATPPSGLLTSNALRRLPSPPWRVVYEIASERLGGVEHVMIGPGGVFAVVTSMEPLPEPIEGTPDAHAIAGAAIKRGALDDALRRCGMSSDRLVTIHWGQSQDTTSPFSVDVLPGATAVDGRRVDEWATSTVVRADGTSLTPAQVDLAWQTVVTAIGRPDPLA